MSGEKIEAGRERDRREKDVYYEPPIADTTRSDLPKRSGWWRRLSRRLAR